MSPSRLAGIVSVSLLFAALAFSSAAVAAKRHATPAPSQGTPQGTPTDRRIYKVDSVVATVKGRVLVIEAKGAVRSGGWRDGRLHRIHASEPGTVAVEFVATPPSPDMTVIEGLVPISASLKLPAARKLSAVRAAAEANEVTSQILH
jgi:hypothetical protein